MSTSTIFFGGSIALRNKEIQKLLHPFSLDLSKSSSDLHIVDLMEEKKSIGIDQVRAAISFLSKKPFESSHKAVVIQHSEALTQEAQNALLKTLEEPPSYALMILSAKTEYALLPTILSRCIKTQLKPETQTSYSESIIELSKLPKGKLLEWAAEKAKEEKSDNVELFEAWLEELHNELIGKEPKLPFESLKNLVVIIQKVKEDLEKTNLNHKLALEYLVLNI